MNIDSMISEIVKSKNFFGVENFVIMRTNCKTI